MRIKRDKVLRWIRRAVANLEPKTYKAYHKYHQPRLEKDEDGKPGWRIGYLADHAVNHYRRAKKMYDDHGLPGVQAYLRHYGYEIKQNVQ